MEILKDLRDNFPRDQWLGQLTKNDQYSALCLLLEVEDFDCGSISRGFQQALFNMAPNCLDTIVKHGMKRDVPLTFPCGPYHFLFRVCKRHPDNNVVECTKVLIDNGFDVEEKANVTGLYPLYTLIQHARETFVCGESLEAEVTCLSLLLEAGADPNFRFGA